MPNLSRIIKTALLVSGIVAPVQAGPVLVWSHDSLRHLYTVDVATREASFVSSTTRTFLDIAFDSNGDLFGVSFGGALHRIDPSTGSSSAIGDLGVGLNSLVFGFDGSLWSAGPNALYRVNTDTGAAEMAVDLTPFDSAGDLAFDSSGNLLLVTLQGKLIRIDTEAQSFDIVGDLGFSDVFGLARAPDGTMFGITSGNLLLGVDTNTGVATGIGVITALDFQLGATYGSSFTTEAVPEPSTMVLFAVVLVGIAGRKLRPL